jgi:hypothetical protein
MACVLQIWQFFSEVACFTIFNDLKTKSSTFFSVKGSVQWELNGIKIGINRSIMLFSLAGKCPLPCPKGHRHERSINVFSGFSGF